MTTQNALEQNPARSVAWEPAALLFALLRVLPNLTYPLGNDQATYAVIGRDLLRGQQLYPPSSWRPGTTISAPLPSLRPIQAGISRFFRNWATTSQTRTSRLLLFSIS